MSLSSAPRSRGFTRSWAPCGSITEVSQPCIRRTAAASGETAVKLYVARRRASGSVRPRSRSARGTSNYARYPRSKEARGEAHRRAPDGGLDPRLAARVPRRRATARSSPASGPGVVLDVGCGVGDETARLDGARPARHRRRLQRADRRRDRRARRTDPGTALRGHGRRRARPCATAPSTAVVSSHIIEHFVNPVLHVAELARVLRARRHRVRDHAERARRLREPVPRLPVRARAARVDAALLLRRRRVPRARRRRSAQGRLRGAGARAASASCASIRSGSGTTSPAGPTSGRTRRRCRSCTGCWARARPASDPGSTRAISS